MARLGWIRIAVAGAAAVALAVVAVVATWPLGARAALSMLVAPMGYVVSTDKLSVSAHRATADRLELRTQAGESVLSTGRVEVRYNLRDLLPGSRRLYGLVSLRMDRPHAVVLHRRDGTWNIPLPAQGAAPSHPAPPFDADVVVRGGTVDLIDETRHYSDARHFRLEDLNVDARMHPRTPSQYNVAAIFVEPGGRFPLSGAGKLDDARGFERQHWSAKRILAAPIVNYVVDAPALHALGGELRGIDVLAIGLERSDGTMDRRVSADGTLHRGRLQLAGVGEPIDALHGRFHGTENALLTQRADGTIGGVPLRIAGGLFDIANPKLRLGVHAAGPVPALLRISPSAAQLPLHGGVAVRLLIESDARRPLTVGTFASDRLAYANFPVDSVSGRVAIYGNDATVLHAQGTYAGVGLLSRGNVTLGQQPEPLLVVSVEAPAQTVPYLSQIAPDLPLHASSVLTGKQQLDGRGVVTGSSASASLGATFDVDRQGRGRVGPLTLNFTDGRSLYARAQLDHPHDQTGLVAVAHRIVVSGAAPPELPGVRIAAVPAVSGRLDAALAGQVTSRGALWASGSADAAGLRIAGTTVDQVHATVVGEGGTLGISRVAARGPWGAFDGSGSLNGASLAVEGRYRGDLAAAGAVLGRSDLNGTADVPLRVLRTPDQLVAQVEGARFSGTTVGGVRVAALDGTIGMRGNGVDVYAAAAQAAGGRVVAAGNLGSGTGLDVSAGDIPLSAIPGSSVVHGGTVTAIATVWGATQPPRAKGGVALVGASVRGLPLSATSNVAFAGGRLTVRDATAVAGSVVANADGTVSGVGATTPSYDVQANTRGVDLGLLQRVAGVHLGVPLEGAVDANVAVSGAGGHPLLNGRLEHGGGTINGLAFHDLGASVSAGSGSATVRAGAVTVGSTTIAVSGGATPGTRALRVRAPRANLADFNDYFDEGDVLAGRGSLDVAFSQSGNAVTTRGNVAIESARYRRFAFGATSASWSSAGRTIAGHADVHGRAGDVRIAGSALLPARDPLRTPLDRVPLDVRAMAANVDLGTWLPAAGFYVPVVGRLDAQAEIRGAPRSATATTRAALSNALIGRVPVERATLEAQANRGRVTLRNAVVAVPNLSVTASGMFGLRPTDPIDLRAVATTPDVGALVAVVSGKKIDAAGALVSEAHVTGSLRRPAASDTVELTKGRYSTLSIPRVHAVLSADERTAALDDAQMDLTRGSIRAAIHAPFDLRHPGLRANAPIDGWLQVARVDLADFGPLLSRDTTLKGIVEGEMRITGTTHAPKTAGVLALSGGYYASPELRSPLHNVRGTLALENATAKLSGVHADIGRGTLNASAVVSLGDLHAPAQTLAFQAAATAQNAQIDAPKYLRGTVDGDLQVSRAAGAPVRVAGNVSIPSARVPLSALYHPGPANATPQAPPPIAFDVNVNVGNDVRVQSGQVDVGGQGAAHVGGTLASPTLAGMMRATGGSLSFYRTFDLQNGVVRFDPANGIMPSVYAVATTRVPEPETYVTLTVSGLAPDNLNVQLSSDPYYERSQILGLLLGAQQLGAVSGIGSTTGSAPSAGAIAQSFAETALSQQFTRQLLEPLSAQLGRGLGLNQFAINYDPSGGFAANARKRIAQHIDAVYAQTFNFPSRQSFGIEAHPRPGTSVQLTFFQQQGTGKFDPQLYATSTNPALTASEPTGGTSGWTFVFQKRFWGGRVKPKPSPVPSSVPATAANR